MPLRFNDGFSLSMASRFVSMVSSPTMSLPMILPMFRSSVFSPPDIAIGLTSFITFATFTSASMLPASDFMDASMSMLSMMPSAFASSENNMPLANLLKSSSPSFIHWLKKSPSPSALIRLLLILTLIFVFSISGIPVMEPSNVPEKTPSFDAKRSPATLKSST